jgi:hypothetical protein
MAVSYWLPCAMCQNMIGPPGLYKFPSHLPTGHATSPAWLDVRCAMCHISTV